MNASTRRSPHEWDDSSPGHASARKGPARETGLFDTGLWGARKSEEVRVLVEEDPSGRPLIDLEGRNPTAGIRPGLRGAPVWIGRLFRTRRQESGKPFRGRHMGVVSAEKENNPCDLAWDATIRAAAPFQMDRGGQAGLAVRLRMHDLRRKLRWIHPGRLLLFVVDISGSMGEGHMGLAKRAALLLLRHAYVKRDRVAVVAFRNQGAALLVAPTSRAETVSRTLTGLACGGKTPLGAGLSEAKRVLDRVGAGNPSLRSFLILISDGRANVGARPGFPAMMAEIEAGARSLRSHSRLTTLFLDTTEEGKDDSPARMLADLLKAERFLLWKMRRSGADPVAEIGRAVR